MRKSCKRSSDNFELNSWAGRDFFIKINVIRQMRDSIETTRAGVNARVKNHHDEMRFINARRVKTNIFQWLRLPRLVRLAVTLHTSLQSHRIAWVIAARQKYTLY